jgi:hypothetical protein
LTGDKVYRFFISSTYTDLKDERRAVSRAILEAGHIPVGMELFPANDGTIWKTIEREIRRCDYYIVLVGKRYGSHEPHNLTSYTEREFDFAVNHKIPVIALIHREAGKVLGDKETQASCKRLTKFRQKLEKRNCQYWNNIGDLAGALKSAISYAIKEDPRKGMIEASYEAVAAAVGGHKLSNNAESSKAKAKTTNELRRILEIECIRLSHKIEEINYQETELYYIDKILNHYDGPAKPVGSKRAFYTSYKTTVAFDPHTDEGYILVTTTEEYEVEGKTLNEFRRRFSYSTKASRDCARVIELDINGDKHVDKAILKSYDKKIDEDPYPYRARLKVPTSGNPEKRYRVVFKREARHYMPYYVGECRLIYPAKHMEVHAEIKGQEKDNWLAIINRFFPYSDEDNEAKPSFHNGTATSLSIHHPCLPGTGCVITLRPRNHDVIRAFIDATHSVTT